MNRILLLNSHLVSGSPQLVDILNENDRIQIAETNISYESIADIQNLFHRGHKLHNSAAIYGDHLLFNINFWNKSFYPCMKFIYFIRPGSATLNELVEKLNYTTNTAMNYYCVRKRRLYEMATQTPGADFLTQQNLADGKGLDLIEEYLQLPEPLNPTTKSLGKIEDVVPYPVLQQAEDYYEKYLFLFKQLKLLCP